MEVNLTLGEQALLWKAKKTNLKAYENAMRGLECASTWNQKNMAQARRYFQAAISHDKDYGFAHAYKGMIHFLELIFGWGESPSISFERAEECIKKALSVSEDIDLAYGLSAWLHMMKRQFDEAIEKCQRAIEIAPNGAIVHLHYGLILSYMEDEKRKMGIQLLKKAFRLDPIPAVYFYTQLAVAYRNDGQYKKAIELCKKVIEKERNMFHAYPSLVQSLVMIGRDEEAKAYAQTMLEIHPNFSVNYNQNANPFKDKARSDEFANALRKAGLPD
jgi:tetratricopeptide (TPR) repeat protein